MAAKTPKTPATKTVRGAADERLVRNPAANVRGDRGEEDTFRAQDTGLLSSAELDKLIESEFEQTALPAAPARKGYHRCWLTTGSSYDTLAKRERLGYRPVKRSSEPKFDPSNGQKLVGHESFITCNEMVLFEIEDARYQAIMKFFHHRKPMDEEAAIVNAIKDNAAQAGVDAKGNSRQQTEGGADDGLQQMETGVEYAKRQNPVFS